MTAYQEHSLEKKPLYRKINARTWGVRLNGHFGEYRQQRHTKAELNNPSSRGSMRGKSRHGLDYTPLFRFLLSRVGGQWDEIYSEAVSRLDRPEPIFWMVALHEDRREQFVCLGESSYFSGLYVDERKRLQIVNPELKAEHMTPYCHCCTHTFNGFSFGQRKD